MRANQLAEGARIAGPRPIDQLSFGGLAVLVQCSRLGRFGRSVRLLALASGVGASVIISTPLRAERFVSTPMPVSGQHYSDRCNPLVEPKRPTKERP
jgi:hypothetical protein